MAGELHDSRRGTFAAVTRRFRMVPPVRTTRTGNGRRTHGRPGGFPRTRVHGGALCIRARIMRAARARNTYTHIYHTSRSIAGISARHACIQRGGHLRTLDVPLIAAFGPFSGDTENPQCPPTTCAVHVGRLGLCARLWE